MSDVYIGKVVNFCTRPRRYVEGEGLALAYVRGDVWEVKVYNELVQSSMLFRKGSTRKSSLKPGDWIKIEGQIVEREGIQELMATGIDVINPDEVNQYQKQQNRRVQVLDIIEEKCRQFPLSGGVGR